ncbi:YceI family protein [Perlabentimonas gracilis]|uniref:YceI family protein n=1 Tax=Perlabentimonas gracilis TaxID=2715279 RepID=UPI001409A08E|nr:YceI family protein [Perlabentimonas gracilis]NHB69300.1 YceI family protein [Perlabentimonas gracilis]
MKLRTIFIMMAVLAVGATSCMQSPEGEKVKSDDATEIHFAELANTVTPNLALSKVEWLGTKPTGTHYGTLSIKEGSLFVKDGELTGGVFVLDMNSIVVLDIDDPKMNENLVGHLKSADFFLVDSFPTATFKFSTVTPLELSTEVEGKVNPTHRIEGNLTMRGITRRVNFPAKIKIDEQGISAKTPQFVINRTEWNVNYGSKSVFANLKDNFIHDEIGITITIRTE